MNSNYDNLIKLLRDEYTQLHRELKQTQKRIEKLKRQIEYYEHKRENQQELF